MGGGGGVGCFFFQAEDGIRDLVRSRGLGDVYKRQDVETGLQRKRKEDEWNRLDAYALAFHQRVREGYHELCRQEPERWRVIDAMQPKEAVQLALRQAVMQFLQEKIND